MVAASARSPNKRLVIFGAGYLGLEVARTAIARGLGVTALTRNAQKAAELAKMGVSVVVADLASSDWHHRVEEAPDYVLNCVSSGGNGLEGYRKSYVEGMRSVVSWAQARGPVGTLVYTSSTSVYPQSGGVTVDESAPTEGASDTAKLLLEAENGLRAARASACRRWFVLRLAGIYGPGRHHLLDQVRGRAQVIAGRGDYRLNLVHRDDIVTAVWAALLAPDPVVGGVFNVVDDQSAQKMDLVRWLAERLGMPVPQFDGKDVSLRRGAVPDRVISNAKIKAALSWSPRYPDFRSGYEALLASL